MNKGLTIIELIVVTAIITSSFAGVFAVLSIGFRSQDMVEKEIKAAYLAEEAIEAVRNIRSQDWDNIGLLSSGTNYYLITSQSEEKEWLFSASNPGLIDEIFTRTINADGVYRDSNDDISDSGNLDPNTKKITVKVLWTYGEENKETAIPIYLTNWKM